jgi:hypothetical protein
LQVEIQQDQVRLGGSSSMYSTVGRRPSGIGTREALPQSLSRESRILRVPRITGISCSMTKRMRGTSVSQVHMVAEIGAWTRSAPACQA